MSDTIYREDAINALEKLSACEEYGIEVGTDEETYIGKYEAVTAISDLPSADRPQGEWIEKPHKVYLPRDYVPDITDYHDCQYNEEDHSIIQYWWHCNQCDYEADRWTKPTFNYCPNCGADMRGNTNERHDIQG